MFTVYILNQQNLFELCDYLFLFELNGFDYCTFLFYVSKVQYCMLEEKFNKYFILEKNVLI